MRNSYGLKACQEAFERLKSLLTTAPIMRPPNWSLPFELMCDANDYAVGVILGQREDGKPYGIMLVRPPIMLKRTTQLLKKSSLQWCSHLINSGTTFWELQ